MGKQTAKKIKRKGPVSEEIIVSDQCLVVEVSGALADIFGYEREELIGKSPFFLCTEESHELLQSKITNGDRRQYRATGIRKDGTMISLDISGRRSQYLDRPVTVVSIQEHSQESNYEEIISAAEDRYRAMADSATDAIFSINSCGDIIFANDAATRLFGYEAVELMGASLTMLIPEEHRSAHAKGIEHFLRTGVKRVIGRTVELEAVRRDGTRFPVELSVATWSNQNEVFFTGIVRDITDHRNALMAIEEGEKRFRDLVEAGSECICRIDPEGYFLYMSPCGLRSHHMSRLEEVIGKHMTELAEPPYHELLCQTLEKAKHGEVQHFEYESDTAEGVRWFESSLTPQKDASGRIISFIRVSRDVTDRRSAEESLVQSWKALQKTLQGTVEALSSTVGLRDPYTAEHQQRVSTLAGAIAQELGLDEDTISGIKVAGTLHDIGKINIPAEILSKPGRLSEFEFQIIQGHAQASYDILKNIDFPWPVATAVLQHHERLDGSGYPNGLSGAKIIIESKIIAVADVVEAMASRRPYRTGLGLDAALTEIKENRGRLFDSDIVDACIELFEKKYFDFRRS